MILSLDGGATKTVALVFDEINLNLCGIGLSGPTNLTSVTKEEVISNIRRAVSKACQEADIKISSLHKGIFGVAGIGDSPSLTKFGEEIISESTGRNDFHVLNDGIPAYEMANLDLDGIVFAGGTGSVAFLKNGNRIERRGGWNWFAGDNGSASWIARSGLNLATFEYDGIYSEKYLIEGVESYFKEDFREALTTIERSQNKRHVAGFAPIVTKLAETGYPPASKILDESADYVADLIKSTLYKFKKVPRVSLVGGTMLAGRTYTDRIKSRLNMDINVYYGYQVAAGGLLLILKELGLDYSFETRDKILEQMNIKLMKKSKDELYKFLSLTRF